MKLNFPYRQSKNKADAYLRVQKHIDSDEFKQLGLNVDIEHKPDEFIKATGKGFVLNATFDEQQMDLELKLSLLLKPLSKKISKKLNDEFSGLV